MPTSGTVHAFHGGCHPLTFFLGVKLENFLMGILIFNSDYFWNENPAARGEDIAF
jgi:hypothetical protein